MRGGRDGNFPEKVTNVLKNGHFGKGCGDA